MKKFTLLTVLASAIYVNGMSQFQHSFGTPSREFGQSVQITSPDAGYIIGGNTTELFLGGGDATLVKTDPNGIIMWSKVYGGSNADLFTCVRQLPTPATSTISYVAVGQTYSFGFGGSDVYFVLTDATGIPLISRVFGGAGFDKAYCVQNVKLPSGAPGFIIVGETNSFPSLPGNNVYAILTDQLGNLIRSAVFGYKGNQRGYWVEQTSDGGFIIVGSSTYQCGMVSTSTAVSEDIYAVKLDANLNFVWDRIVGGGTNFLDRSDIAYSVKENPYDKSLVITGRTHSFSPNTLGEAYLLSFSSVGAFNFLLTYGLKDQEEGHSLLLSRVLNDVDYVVAGYTRSIPYNNVVNTQALLFKTNSSGAPYWARVYGLQGSEAAMEVHYAKLPGFVFTGYETSYGAGSSDIYLVETDINGKSDSPCEKEIDLQINKHDPCIFKSTKIFYVTPSQQLHNIYKDVDYKTNKCSIILPAAESLTKSAQDQINGENTVSKIAIAPNPANSLITIKNSADYQNGTVRIMNIHGQQISDSKIIEGESVQFNIEHLSPGIYFLDIRKNGSNSPEFHKLLKQ